MLINCVMFSGPSTAGKDINLLVYIKRRLAMCARKLGRIKEAVKMMRDVSFLCQCSSLLFSLFMWGTHRYMFTVFNTITTLPKIPDVQCYVCFLQLMKEFPLLGMLNIHENLLEALLELQAYADVQAVLAKYDGMTKQDKHFLYPILQLLFILFSLKTYSSCFFVT